MIKISYQWFVPFTYSVEKVGLMSNDAFNVGLETLYDKIDWLKQNERSSRFSWILFSHEFNVYFLLLRNNSIEKTIRKWWIYFGKFGRIGIL